MCDNQRLKIFFCSSSDNFSENDSFALVGAGVAVFVGLAIWVVVGELNSHYTGPYTVLAKNLLARVPRAAGGGALGGALAGFIGSFNRSLMNTPSIFK